MRRWFRNARGFTLIEMLLVVTIVGVLTAILIPTLSLASKQARNNALRGALSHLQDASDRYWAINALYPTTGQPGACPDAFTIDWAATGVDGKALMPGYLRFLPQTAAQELGLGPGQGTTVYYGVTSSGKVFGTQTPPSAGGEWTNGGTVVYTQEDAPKFTTLANICNGNGTGGVAGSALVLALSTGQQEIAVGGTIPVTATVTSGGVGVPGKLVQITASGSVTGPQYDSCTTDSTGACTVNISSSTPQYVVISATVQ